MAEPAAAAAAGPGPSTPDQSKVASSSGLGISPPQTPLSPIYRSPIRPLKSILRPPPPPPKNVFTSIGSSITQNFLSLPSKFLPGPAAAAPPPGTAAPTASSQNTSALTPASAGAGTAAGAAPQQPAKKPLKRAHFRMPVLSVTYSISSSLPPCSPETSKSRLQAEEALRETLVGLRESAWSAERVEGFYRDCCRTREERPDERVVHALNQGLNTKPRVLDFAGIPLSVFHAAAVADVLALNLRLAKVSFDGCDLDEQSLHPLLHALLISASLPALSLANNPRLKPGAFTLIQTYLSRARRLSSLDLSGVPLPPPTVQILVQVLARREEDADGRETPLSPKLKGKGVRKEDWEVARLLLSEPWHEEGVDDGDGLITLRLDNCALKPASLEILAHAIRPSQLCHLSLRTNRISASGAVALAVLMKDYPDTAFQPIVMPPSAAGSSASSPAPTPPPRLLPPRPPTHTHTHLPASASSLSISTTPASPSSEPGAGATTPTTTYAAYVPKVKRLQQGRAAAAQAGRPPPAIHYVPPLPPSLQSGQNTPRSTPSASPRGAMAGLPLSQSMSNLSQGQTSYQSPSHSQGQSQGLLLSTPRRPSPPIITSNADGGITTRHAVSGAGDKNGNGNGGANGNGNGSGPNGGGGGGNGGGGGLPSPALLSSVRGMDEVPRLGRLRTVDLKGNDIRTGVTYIAQVLKRNRTLRVLNLAENRIDEKGLSALAEALKYNETLETLDLSGNPCCGPSLEGVTSLRMAFTVNRSLRRLFLAGTNLSSAAAIHLAEFVPESHTLLHLDLTRNELDYAGILALSAGMRSNTTLRCLDLSIPPNDEGAARCSREILQACIRNTEKAGRGGELLGKSEILHTLRGEGDEARKAGLFGPGGGNGPQQPGQAGQPGAGAAAGEAKPLGKSEKERLKVVRLSEAEVVDCVGEICRGERDVGEEARRALEERVEEMIRAERGEARLAGLLELMDGLTGSGGAGGRRGGGKGKGKGVNGDVAGLGINGREGSPVASSSGPSTPVSGGGAGRSGSSNSLSLSLSLSLPSSPPQLHPAPSPASLRSTPTPPAQRFTVIQDHAHTHEHALSPAFSITSGSGSDDESDEELLGADGLGGLGALGEGVDPDAEELGRDIRVGAVDGLGNGKASADGEVAGDAEGAGGSALPLSSPVEERSKYWVEEEGEVFRRGHALLTQDEMEDEGERKDVDGEELRKELLETEVRRPPPRAVPLPEDEAPGEDQPLSLFPDHQLRV